MGPLSPRAHKTSKSTSEEMQLREERCAGPPRPGCIQDDSGVGSAGLGAQWRGEERPLVWGDTCACVSEDRRAQPFGEFPVVLSLTSAQDVLCPDNLAPPPCLALNVCSHHMLL